VTMPHTLKVLLVVLVVLLVLLGVLSLSLPQLLAVVVLLLT